MKPKSKSKTHEEPRIVTERQWQQLTQQVLTKVSPFFSSEERAVTAGFIQCASGYVEATQIEELRLQGSLEPPPNYDLVDRKSPEFKKLLAAMLRKIEKRRAAARAQTEE